MRLNSLYKDIIFEESQRQKIKLAIQEIGRNQKQLARRIGCNESTISRYKNGKRVPSLRTLQRLAKQGINVAEVFNLNPKLPEQPINQYPDSGIPDLLESNLL